MKEASSSPWKGEGCERALSNITSSPLEPSAPSVGNGPPFPMRFESRKRRACAVHTPTSTVQNRKPQKVGTPLAIEETTKPLLPSPPLPSTTTSTTAAATPFASPETPLFPIQEWQRTPPVTRTPVRRNGGDVTRTDSPLYSLQGLSLRSPALTKSPAITPSPGSSFSYVPQSPGVMQSPHSSFSSLSSFSPFPGGSRTGGLQGREGPWIVPRPSPVRQVPVTVLSHPQQHPQSSFACPTRGGSTPRMRSDASSNLAMMPPTSGASPKKAKLSPRPRGDVSRFFHHPTTDNTQDRISSRIFFPVDEFGQSPRTKRSSKRLPIKSPIKTTHTTHTTHTTTTSKTTSVPVRVAPQYSYAPKPKRDELNDVVHKNYHASNSNNPTIRRKNREDAEMDELLLGFTSQAKHSQQVPSPLKRPILNTVSPQDYSSTLPASIKPFPSVHLSPIDKGSITTINVPLPRTEKQPNPKSIGYLRPRASSHFNVSSNESLKSLEPSDSEQSVDSFFLNHPKKKGARAFSPLDHNNSYLSLLTSTNSLCGMDIIHENSSSKTSLLDADIPKTKSRCFSEDGSNIRHSTSESSLASSIGLNLERMPSYSDLSARDMVTPPAMAYSLSGPPPIKQTFLTSVSTEVETPPRKYLPSVENDACTLDKFSF